MLNKQNYNHINCKIFFNYKKYIYMCVYSSILHKYISIILLVL